MSKPVAVAGPRKLSLRKRALLCRMDYVGLQCESDLGAWGECHDPGGVREVPELRHARARRHLVVSPPPGPHHACSPGDKARAWKGSRTFKSN